MVTWRVARVQVMKSCGWAAMLAKVASLPAGVAV
jgi:hypothetical protein